MNDSIFSRSAVIKPILIGGDDLALPTNEPTKETPVVTVTAPPKVSVATVGGQIVVPPIIAMTFEQPMVTNPPKHVKGAIGDIIDIISSNTPTDILMGDIKHPTATAPTGGVKTPAAPAATTATTDKKETTTTDNDNYKKWFVITVVVLGIIILIRVFK